MDREQEKKILATAEEEITLKKKELAVIITCLATGKKDLLEITPREVLEALASIPELEAAIAEWRGQGS